jgi:hypothetical protein
VTRSQDTVVYDGQNIGIVVGISIAAFQKNVITDKYSSYNPGDELMLDRQCNHGSQTIADTQTWQNAKNAKTAKGISRYVQSLRKRKLGIKWTFHTSEEHDKPCDGEADEPE